MTTLVALATKDALVMGCDSLATASKSLIDPRDLFRYFDPENDYQLRLDAEGKPLLKNFGDIWRETQPVPYNHMTHVDKLVDLKPFPMGVMATGITSIGNRTIKNLISEFKTDDSTFSRDKTGIDYTVNDVADRLLTHIQKYYLLEYPEDKFNRPDLELIIGGYDKQNPLPRIFRIKFPEFKVVPTIPDFGIVFGGQMIEIQRIVFGTDMYNQLHLEDRYEKLLRRFSEEVKKQNKDVVLPDIDAFTKEFHIFGRVNPDDENDERIWSLFGFDANWGDFSEQNAIDCVNFFIEVMINAQQFSATMPTVGGEIHVALITRENGFRFISKEEYRHEQHAVPRKGPGGVEP